MLRFAPRMRQIRPRPGWAQCSLTRSARCKMDVDIDIASGKHIAVTPLDNLAAATAWACSIEMPSWASCISLEPR